MISDSTTTDDTKTTEEKTADVVPRAEATAAVAEPTFETVKPVDPVPEPKPANVTPTDVPMIAVLVKVPDPQPPAPADPQPVTDVAKMPAEAAPPTAPNGDASKPTDTNATVSPISTARNLTPLASRVIAAFPLIGSGTLGVQFVHDGNWRGAPDISDPQYPFETFHGGQAGSPGSVGYVFDTPQTFDKVVFQEGKHFDDGGWLLDLKVQVRQRNAWIDVDGFAATPPYPGNGEGNGFGVLTLTFDRIVGDGIRIAGTPGGSRYFMSVAQLEVWATPGDAVPAVPPSRQLISARAVAAMDSLLDRFAADVERGRIGIRSIADAERVCRMRVFIEDLAELTAASSTTQ